MEYTQNNLVFVDIPGTPGVMLKGVTGPARSAKVLTVPQKVEGKPVSQLGSLCCADLDMESINLPESINRIDEGAFSGCKNLKSFTVPKNCLYIGESAFGYCSALSNFTYNVLYTHIRSHTFTGCASFKNVTLPKNAVVDAYAFGNVVNLTIPQFVTRIHADAFSRCPIQSITFLGSSTEGLVCRKFAATLKRVVFGGTGVLIGDGAFDFCMNLESVEGDIKRIGKRGLAHTKITSLGGNIEYVGEEGLSGTNLTSVPRGLKRADKAAFSHCHNIKSCDFSALDLVAIPEYMFMNSGLEQVNIGSSVTHIGKGAFDSCRSLKSVNFGGYSSNLKYIAENAFCDCPQLRGVRIPSSVTYIGGGAFVLDRDSLAPVDISFDRTSGWRVRNTIGSTMRETDINPADLGYSNAGSTYARYRGFEWRRT